MTVAVAMSMATEHVVESLQEEEHDDASKCRETIQGVKDMSVASLGHLHRYGLGDEEGHILDFVRGC